MPPHDILIDAANDGESQSEPTTEELTSERLAIIDEVKRLHRLVSCLAHQGEVLTRERMHQLANRLIGLNRLLELEDASDSTSIFNKIKSINKQLIEDEREASTADAHSNSSHHSAASSGPMVIHSIAHDPNITVKPWDGSALGYYEFEKRFVSNYVDNPAYSDANRFAAFSSLIGERGRNIIGVLEDDKEGLNVAMIRIKERFGNISHIRTDIERKLTSIPMVKSKRDVAGLSTLLNTAESSLKVLQQSGSNEDYLEHVFFKMIVLKLPFDTVDSFNCSSWNSKDPKKLITFIRKRIEQSNYSNELHRVPGIASIPTQPRVRVNVVRSNLVTPTIAASPYPRSQPSSSIARRSQSNPEVCRLCGNESHIAIRCNFGTVEDRQRIAAENNFCSRCVRNHPPNACRSSYVCHCGEPHSRVLCPTDGMRAPQRQAITGNDRSVDRHTAPKTLASQSSATPSANINVTIPEAGINITAIHAGHHLPLSRPELLTVYHQTVVVNINGQRVRVQLDSGSGRTLITEELANRLKLPIYATHKLRLGGFDGTSSQPSSRLVKARLQSLDGRHSTEMIFCVSPTIDHQPAAATTQLWEDIRRRGFDLSDSPENDQRPVEALIGQEYYRLLFTGHDVAYNSELSLRHSVFGWVLQGVTETSKSEQSSNRVTRQRKRRPPFVGIVKCSNTDDCQHLPEEESAKIESSSPASPSSAVTEIELSPAILSTTGYSHDRKLEDQYVRDFIRTHVHFQDQRYSVNLPWIRPIEMENNKQLALLRFYRLQRSLDKRKLTSDYHAAMSEMIGEYTEPANDDCTSPKCYYMPHHPVVRLDKETTKLRIVFDASSHSPTSPSLNDHLYKGVMNWDLINLLLRFRLGQHALIADVEKAFLRIKVQPEDRDAFRFWWFDDHGQICSRRFTSVPFGTSASPFLLFAAFYHLFLSNRTKFSDVVPIIERNMYVDDFIAAFQHASPAQLDHLRTRSIELFKSAGMNLRKFRTNEATLDKKWTDSTAKESVKVLGHSWNTRTDTFSPAIDTSQFLSSTTMTKRQFTSFVQSVYNPTGIVAPFTLKLKFALKELWKLKLKWDQNVPESEFKAAMELVRDSQLVNEMVAPRNLLPVDNSPVTLRIYCDASKQALGVVAYLCSTQGNFLFLAKSRLAREATIPELELDALVMAATLANYLARLHSFDEVIICGDSKLNLQRLLQHPNKQKPSVALRVNQIKRLAPSAVFRHVESKQNLADLVSRGTSMKSLLGNKEWLNAPELLPNPQFESTVTAHVLSVKSSLTDCTCTRFSSYNRAINTYLHIARIVKRYGKNARYQQHHELDLARNLLIRTIQRAHFPTEIDALESSDAQLNFDRESILYNFTVYVDSDGLLRLRSRIKPTAEFSLDEVHPIILPNNCHFSRLVAAHVHYLNYHPGVDRTCHSIRERYFIINQRKMVKALVNSCKTCRLKRSAPPQITAGQLPAFRNDVYRPPFTNTGIDLFGPLKVTMTTPGPRYGVIFSCATSRLVHIEVVPEMTAEHVFEAVRRFIARRGLPQLFYGDNGTQFVKVKKDLKGFINLVNKERPDLELKFEWIHLTTHSPWRGGFYERLIRSIKDALVTLSLDRKVTKRPLLGGKPGEKKKAGQIRGEKVLTDQQLVTYMAEIEALINNRPLFMHDGRAIKPTDFLGAQGSIQLPIVGNLPSDYDRPNIIRDYTISQRRLNSVRRLWKDSYVLQLRGLHHRNKQSSKLRNFEEGDVVHVKKPSTPLDKWPLGLVTKVVVSDDGIVRSVQLRTFNHGSIVTEYKDVRNLIPVECNHERHELALATDSSPSTEAPAVLASSSTRPSAGKSRVSTKSLDKLAAQWTRQYRAQQKDVDYRQSLRSKISNMLSKGSSVKDTQIQTWVQELYSLSSDPRCRSLSTTSSPTR